MSSCGSAGTKLSSPGSLGLTNEADSRDHASLLENQNRLTVKTISSKTSHTEVMHIFVNLFLRCCTQLAGVFLLVLFLELLSW